MKIIEKVTNGLASLCKITICCIALVSTFYSVINLMYFLSDPNSSKTLRSKDGWLSISSSLFCNMCLLSLFIMQHSILAISRIQSLCSTYRLNEVYRSLYVITTSLVLQLLISYWQNIPDVVFWKMDMANKLFWCFHMGAHVGAWVIIYTGSICMDMNELLGIKQVYYSLLNLPDPNLRKSHQLKRLNAHMRHPSFLAFLLVFWIVPVMTLDRLLLAVILTLYMYLTWNTDERDYAYQKDQYERKFHELEHLKT